METIFIILNIVPPRLLGKLQPGIHEGHKDPSGHVLIDAYVLLPTENSDGYWREITPEQEGK